MPALEYAFDEGVYIQQARLLRAGQLPYRDFFHHQTPLYPITLALVAAPAPEALVLYRLPSLLATALCGGLVCSIALRLGLGWGALVAGGLFFTAPLQYFGLVALPNALMLATATAGLACIWFGERGASAALGGVWFAVSLLYKPAAAPFALAAGIALAASPERRWRLPWAAGAGALALAGSWALLHALTDGAFTEMLALQAGRHAEGGGFELVMQFHWLSSTLEREGIGSALEWNLHQHREVLLGLRGATPLLPLTALAAGGQLLLLSPAGRSWRAHRLLLTLWWLVPLLFSLFVWEPTWQFYFVQYLPAFALLAALLLTWLWQRSFARRLTRVAVVAGVVWMAASGAWHVVERRNDYALVPRPEAPGEEWLLFDPFLNFVSGTAPGCGLVDPFNVYGDRSLLALAPSSLRGRFQVRREDLVACLEADPTIKIGLGYWASWFVDDELRGRLRQLPAERFVPMRLHYRPPGGALPPSPERLRR